MTAVAAKSAHADGDILFEMRGAVALVTLNRPHKRNALNTSIVLALEDLFASLPEAAKAAVIAGVGDHFSAGLDLSEVTEQDVAEGIQHSRMWHRAFERIQFGRVPVVSALHGAVVGGGLELAASTHIRVAEKSTMKPPMSASRIDSSAWISFSRVGAAPERRSPSISTWVVT